ncbi:MAG: hypothetical protein IKJ68_13555 [Clostridia bacterium]|nr:hypothetical protein [Clostridia bacterium]
MKTILKKTLSIAIMVSMVISLFAVPTMAVQPELPDWEILMNPVYEMGFEPDSDGKFYDSPVGTPGRQEVARLDNPEGMVDLSWDKANVDNKIISSSGESSRIYANNANNLRYSAFENDSANGEYYLKLVDNNTNTSGTTTTTIEFPQAYGAANDTCDKYRFEMDWKWQQFKTSAGKYITEEVGTPGGTTLFTFYIGGSSIALTSKADNEASDARGAAAMYLHSEDFGMYASNQTTEAADVANVTESAEKFTEAQSGEWIHVTVDFDFTNGTVYVVLEGENETREISTQIVKGGDIFANGIDSFKMAGAKKSIRRMNYIDNVKLSPISRPDLPLSQGERMGETAYKMDFSPDSDGKFYDLPAGFEGRKEIARVDNPEGIKIMSNDGGNLDNKVLSTDNTGKIYTNLASIYNYSAITKGQAENDFNTGASGAVDDYCLRQVDVGYGDTQDSGLYIQTGLNFPQIYGGTDDITHKYRFEVDWKWQSYRTSAGSYIVDTTEEPQNIKGSSIFAFYIGDAVLYLRGDYNTGNISFYESDTYSKTVFGLTASNQSANVTDLTGITTAMPRLTEAEQGKWIHITIDFDFENGTLDATVEGENESGSFSTTIGKGQDEFKKGISGIKLMGSVKNKRKANFMDNVTMTPIMTKEPAIKANGNKLMWKAVSGAASYNVYAANTADGAKQAVSVKKLDTTSNPGYVIATLNFADDSAKYYTVTATSDNKGESYHSNSVSIAPKNIISKVDFEITSAAEGKSTAKVTAEVEAACGFDKEIKLMAAVYNSKELISLSETPLTEFSRGTEGKLELTLNDLTTLVTSEMSIKFFIWDEDITPVKKSETLSYTQWHEKLENSGLD